MCRAVKAIQVVWNISILYQNSKGCMWTSIFKNFTGCCYDYCTSQRFIIKCS